MTRLRTALLAFLTVGLLLPSLAPPLSRAQAPASDTMDVSLFRTTPLLPTDTSLKTDVPFVRSPKEVVVQMLDLANATEDDVVYDLGSGDGRIPITAAQRFGAQGVGIEIQPDLVEKARRRAEVRGVADRVDFRQGDLFKADISDATVVTLYLLPEVNTELRPKLFEQLAPGTRVVSHDFDMDAWEPDTTVQMDDSFLYLWTIPEEIPPHLDN